MTGARVAVGLIVLLLVTGCAAGGGQPAPAQPTDVRSATPAPAVPDRPRDVPIDGVDPCTLLTEEQRAELGLDGDPVPDHRTSPLYNTDVSMCATRGFEPRVIAVGVSLVPETGIEFFTSGQLSADIRHMQVAGYPAVLAVPTRFTDFCTVVVDVAPGQLVEIQFRDGGGQPAIPQERLCRDAQQTAGLVMDTLLSRR